MTPRPTVSTRRSVAIVGAGPTGLMLANLLGLEGVDVLVVERNSSTVHEPRAVSIDDESLRTLQAAGLVTKALDDIVPGYGSIYYGPNRRSFTQVMPSEQPYGYPRRNAFRQPILEAQLRAGLARFSHVETLFSHKVESLDETNDGVRASIVAPDGRRIDLMCDYLIGCDGAGSTVRRLLGFSLEGSSFNERWLIIDLDNCKSSIRDTEVFCDPRRPFITLPGPGETRRFEFKLHEHETDEQMHAPGTISSLLEAYPLPAESTIVRQVVYRFHARLANRWSTRRVFLAGDAAHLTPPFAGQGMNSGMRDAHNLFWKLSGVIQGRVCADLLQTYEMERRDHARQMIHLALTMGAIMAPPNSILGFVVRNGFRMLNRIPAVRNYITEMRYKPKPRFRAGFLFPDAKSARHTLVGRLIPQARVQLPNGRICLFDDVIGNRFALVAWTRRPMEIFRTLDQPAWHRLGVERIAIVPNDGSDVESPIGVDVVRQIGSPPIAIERYMGEVLLLRPDHYVAAAFRPSAASRASDLISNALNKPTRRGEHKGATSKVGGTQVQARAG